MQTSLLQQVEVTVAASTLQLRSRRLYFSGTLFLPGCYWEAALRASLDGASQIVAAAKA
jgi:hypothetical protein